MPSKVLMMSWRGPHHPRRGGAEVYTEELLAGLATRGYEVAWYSANPTTPSHRTRQWRGIQLIYGNNRGLGIYYEGHQWLKSHAAQYDFIVDQLNTFGFLSPVIKLPRSVTPIAMIHQLAKDIWRYEVPQPLDRLGWAMEQRMLRYYRALPFITVSPSTLNDVRSMGWSGVHKIIPNGVVLGTPSPKTTHPVITFLGRVNAKAKRLYDALAIFHLVKQQVPRAEFWIIGRGRLPKGIAGHGIRHYNGVSDALRDQMLAQSWLCLATSVREGWGRMVSESAAVKTPAVVYDVPGLRDAVIHDRTGLIVPPNPHSAATAIINLIANPQALHSMAEVAYDRIKQQSWDHSIDTFQRALQEFAQLRHN